MSVNFQLNGNPVDVPDSDASLLDVLREDLGAVSVKDGCSPQGQCGCCTVLVDGAPRVSCVTPARRVKDREVVTLEGVDPDVLAGWVEAFQTTGASQCGFCTPGILLRFIGLEAKLAEHTAGVDDKVLSRSLAAHLCRCTGWRTIIDAWRVRHDGGLSQPDEQPVTIHRSGGVDRSSDQQSAADLRAELEGGVAQSVAASVVQGLGGFADDTAPDGALVAVLGADDEWVVAESRAEARAAAGKRQGRRTTAAATAPIELPTGDWVRTLQTSWVEPAYLETDAAWCEPGGEPASPLANGGAFGAKASSEVAEVARRLANEHGRAVRVLYSREDAVRRGPKRPPIAAGVRADGTGLIRVAATAGIADSIGAIAPGFEIEEVSVDGPPTSADIRGAGWVEAAVLLASVGPSSGETGETGDAGWIVAPDGGRAQATVRLGATGLESIAVTVDAGDPLDYSVLASYCTGAAHMALSWVAGESLSVDEAGTVHDLTIRSFGVLPAAETPPISVSITSAQDSALPTPTNGSDAVFAAVAHAIWQAAGYPPNWPTGKLAQSRV